MTTSTGDTLTVAFRVDVDAKLTPYKQGLIDELRRRRAEFDASWRRDRGAKSKYPFKSGRDTNSEYEGSIAFFLRSSGWDPQSIMNAIAAWNRMHGIQMPPYASRYGATIVKAFALAVTYGSEPAPIKTKGSWKWHDTKQVLLECISEYGPQTPKEISDHTGKEWKTVKVVLGRLAANGMLDRVNGLYELSDIAIAARFSAASQATAFDDDPVEASPQAAADDEDPCECPFGSMEHEYAAAADAGIFVFPDPEPVRAPKSGIRHFPSARTMRRKKRELAATTAHLDSYNFCEAMNPDKYLAVGPASGTENSLSRIRTSSAI